MGTPLLTNFTDLSEKKKLAVLSWRNDYKVRMWMYNDAIIQKNFHLAFINSLKKDSTKQYFLITYNNEDIGVIYFTHIDKYVAKIGIYANPLLKNVGQILMNTICSYGFKTLNLEKLTAEVFENNIKAIKLYNRFNFKQTSKQTKDNKTILSMELENDNW